MVVQESSLNEKIAALIEPSLTDIGFELIRVRVSGGSEHATLQLMAERPDGTISVEDCAQISRTVSAILDVEDPISSHYVLEVSSPGLARPLVKRKDFDRFKGRVAKIELRQAMDGRKRFKGVLDGMEGDFVMVAEEDDDNDDGEPMVWGLPFSQISEARLVVTDDMFKDELQDDKAHG